MEERVTPHATPISWPSCTDSLNRTAASRATRSKRVAICTESPTVAMCTLMPKRRARTLAVAERDPACSATVMRTRPSSRALASRRDTDDRDMPNWCAIESIVSS